MATNASPAPLSPFAGGHAACNNTDTPTGWLSQAGQSPPHRIPIQNGLESAMVMTPDGHWSYPALSTPVEEPISPEIVSEFLDPMAGGMTSSTYWYSQAGQPTQHLAPLPGAPVYDRAMGEGMAPDGRSYQDGQYMPFGGLPHRPPLPGAPVSGQAMGEVMPPDVDQDLVLECIMKLDDYFKGKHRIFFKSEDGNFLSVNKAIDSGCKSLVDWDKPCQDKPMAAKFALSMQVHDYDTKEEAHSFNNIYIYWRTACTNPHALTKAELGCKISKRLRKSEELKAYCEKKGHNLGDLLLFDLAQKRKGCWQLNLFPKGAATVLAAASTNV